MKVSVQYFAVLRERRGLSSEEIETCATTYRELYDELSAKHNFALPGRLVKVAVDAEFRSMDEPIVDGASVVFIPPVAGG